MHLARITLENLRAMSRLDVDLSIAGTPRRRTILLGINGAGKTTTLDAVAYAFQRLQPFPETEALLRPSDIRRRPEGVEPSETPLAVISLDAVLSPEEYAGAREKQEDVSGSGTLRFYVGAWAAPRPDWVTTIPFATSTFEDFLRGVPASGEWRDVAASAAMRASKAPCVYLPADRGVLTYRDDLPLSEVASFDPRDGAMAKDRRRFGALAVRLALAFAGNKSLDPMGTLARMWKVLARYFPELPKPVAVDGLMLMFRTEAGVIVRLTDLSEGERAVLLVFAEIASRLAEDGVALIDELEQHIHVRWQRAALEALTVMMPSAQVFVTSQSPYVAATSSDDIVKLDGWDHAHA